MQAGGRRVASFGRAKECLGRAALLHRHVGAAGNVDDWVADLARRESSGWSLAATKARRGRITLWTASRERAASNAKGMDATASGAEVGRRGRRRPVRYSKSRGGKGCW